MTATRTAWPSSHSARALRIACACVAAAAVALAGCTPATNDHERAGDRVSDAPVEVTGAPKMSAGVELRFVESDVLEESATDDGAPGKRPVRLELIGPAEAVFTVELEASKGAALSGERWVVALGEDGEGALDASVVVPPEGCSIVARVRTPEGGLQEAVCRMPGDVSEAAKGTTRIIGGRPVRTESSR